MGEIAGIPQWKRELILRRRAAASRPTSASSGFHQPPVGNMRLITTPAEEDLTSDSSEELQYGPGIVSKLKSKYMSMTLRESQQRPSLSSLRRATSLEDLLDGPDNNKSRTRFKKATPDAVPNRNLNRYRAINRGNDSLKRARSVEALVRCNPQVVIVESRLRGDDEPKKMSSPVQRPKRPSQPPDLPRVDLVKQTLRLFEKPKVSPKPSSPTLSRKPPVFKPVTVKTSVVKSPPKPSVPASPVRNASPEPRNVSPINGNGRVSPETQPRTISRTAIENIRAGGTSIEFSFGSGTNKPYLPQRLVGVIRPMVAASSSTPSTATTSITTTTTTIITTITCNSSSNHTTNTLSERELEKNLINRTKSNSNSNSGSGLWEQGRPWNQPHNTMVFNFADSAKPVPDYIENDGLILISRPKSNDGIRLSSTTDGFNPSALSPPSSPPSPCDVQFEGDNILINGRSNLRKAPCIRKHHITFNDEATSTFEYPSESSLLQPETDSLATCPTTEGGTSSPSPSRSTPGVPVPLSGGSLANYQPSKVSLSANDFELGVTRALPTPPRRTPEKIQEPNDLEPESNGPEYLTPAEDGAAWGAAATEGLLF